MGYTYLIGWSHLDKWYYGVRFAKGCSLDDLWTKYFTSSNQVKKFRELHGEPDVVSIRKVFTDKTKAQSWERRVLLRMKVVKSPRWLNANDTFRYDYVATPEVLAKRAAGVQKSWDVLTPEERSRRTENRRARWNAAYDAMKAADKKQFIELSKKKLEKVNARPIEERRADALAGALALKAKIDAMSEEERKEYFASQIATRKVTVDAMSLEDKKAWRDKKVAAWSDDMKGKAAVVTSKSMKEWHSSKTPEQHEEWKSKLRKPKSVKPTQEAIDRRRATFMKTIALRAAKKAAL